MEPNISADPSPNGGPVPVVETVVRPADTPDQTKTGRKTIAVLVLPGLFTLLVIVVGWLLVVMMTNVQQESRTIPREPTAPTQSP